MPATTQQLSRYDTACAALAEARTVDEVRDILNKTEAIKEYARRAKNRALEVDATEIRVRAERRYGELLFDLKASGQIAEGRRKTVESERQFPRLTLVELDTTRDLSSRCQRIASLPAQKFEHMIAEWRHHALEDGGRIAFDALMMEKAERREMRETALGNALLALPQKKYGVIYADPEWHFEVWSSCGLTRGAENHYLTSPLEVIKSRDVPSISAPDCALLLWATQPMLHYALEVLTAWQFEYKSHFVWAKDRIGTGYWSRNKHEILLLGTKGEIPCPAPGDQWDSLIEAPRRGHSEKPELFAELIEAYWPHIPKIELNRRGPPRPGWDAWGFEANGGYRQDNRHVDQCEQRAHV